MALWLILAWLSASEQGVDGFAVAPLSRAVPRSLPIRRIKHPPPVPTADQDCSIEQGLNLAARGMADKAIMELRAVVRETPADWGARMELANLLYAVRDNDQHRADAEDEFMTAMLLRPDRVRVDASLCTGSAIDKVLVDFDAKVDSHKNPSIAQSRDVKAVRKLLTRADFSTQAVRAHFGLPGSLPLGAGAMLAKRLAGRSDGELAVISASDISPSNLLDALVQLFVLGLAVDGTSATDLIGTEALDALRRLGMVTNCLTKPSLIASLVAVTPMMVAHPETTALWIVSDWAPPVSASMYEEVRSAASLILKQDTCACLRATPEMLHFLR